MENEWINIGISLLAPKEKAEGLEKLLQPYADELGWEISSTSKEEQAQISIVPPSRALSPKELDGNLKKIAGVSFGIFKDIVYLGDREKALQNYMQGMVLTAAKHPKHKKEIFFLGHTMGFLWFNYPLRARLKLEEQDPELARSLFFGRSAEEQLRDYFQNKKPEEQDATVKEALEKKYELKL
ncbi:hypothetical protein GF412_03895 [Candidatus Micrarchaeota archaeon]|nr:hypothetical protein [Candidatus Micrarchaeota archaeon]MBD3418092.1 hypothetical protein [Candidatus Micrarchaeota archaeon]